MVIISYDISDYEVRNYSCFASYKESAAENVCFPSVCPLTLLCVLSGGNSVKLGAYIRHLNEPLVVHVGTHRCIITTEYQWIWLHLLLLHYSVAVLLCCLPSEVNSFDSHSA